MDAHIIKNVEDQLRILSSPFLKSFAIIDDETMIATLIKKDVELDRPVSIGTAILGEPSYLYSYVFHSFYIFILERSKAVMYSFLYECMYTFFGRKGCIPLYTGNQESFIEDTWFKYFQTQTKLFCLTSDTDSLVCKVYTSDITADLKKMAMMPVLDTCKPRSPFLTYVHLSPKCFYFPLPSELPNRQSTAQQRPC